MEASTQNSMAAALSVVVTVVLWVSVVVGALALIVFGLGLTASLNGGSVETPFMSTLSDGVTPAQLIGGIAALCVFAPGIIFICVQLRRILRTLAAGDPFVPENAPRLARIAFAVAAVEIGRNLVGMVIYPLMDVDASAFPLSLNLAAWASVAALLVLAQVFREGARLREEEKMTI